MSDATQISITEQVDRAIAKMATGEWRMILDHPDPTQGSMVVGTVVPKMIVDRIASLEEELRDANDEIARLGSQL